MPSSSFLFPAPTCRGLCSLVVWCSWSLTSLCLNDLFLFQLGYTTEFRDNNERCKELHDLYQECTKSARNIIKEEQSNMRVLCTEGLICPLLLICITVVLCSIHLCRAALCGSSCNDGGRRNIQWHHR